MSDRVRGNRVALNKEGVSDRVRENTIKLKKKRSERWSERKQSNTKERKEE